MNNIVIHPTIASDWPALKAARLAALLDAPTAFGASHASAAAFSDADWQQRAVSTPQRTFFLAFDGEQPIGLAAQVVAGNGECHLIAMWVHPVYRGMAVAQGLVEAVKRCAVGNGHTRLVLDVAPENTRAAAFYQKQGFVFLPEWEALESHPHIQVQKMEWLAAA
ncbi:GNAT family N-acetyltransferase [Janthinobacterium lividum]|uniref:GNAT family N-acetyltransferase n=1 Tax=Janthinobacterium lividum TaxID=29581 RepID=UPI0008935853|nr:GNAT family N-acetyltransferase [Janthinobacterium lividum]MCC7713462.1 GNAT family N-acetyltransferase [Janthinobacterium lividum]OEZ66231.1 putative acetyltransferase [Janthinobacterium lividum]WQE26526.1 GNAT family N-acetyltransferase [Janthinobacterium lividum]STQ97417.1 putative acetyltransferase [Janthinobacterium lividum]